MKQRLLTLIALFLSYCLSGQSIDRIKIKGVLLSTGNDVEAVTIFNTSSNKGTITNEKGEFVIRIALRDVIEISALQFQTVSITVNADVIKAKQLKIQLVEQVNHLDAVTLSSGLTGNILTDVKDVKTVEPIRIDMGNMDVDFEYNDEKAFDNDVQKHHLISIVDPEARNYVPDAVKIFKLFFKKGPTIKKDIFKEKEEEERPDQKDLLDVYDHKYISETFNISPEHVGTFITYIEEKGIDPELFKRENEIQLIAFLIKQRELFLKLQNAGN